MPPARLMLACAAAAVLVIARAASAQAAEKPGVPGLADKVIADPTDEAARERLKLAAGLADEGEKEAIAAERAELLALAEQDRKKVLKMRAAREKRLRAWRKELARVCSLASRPDNMKEAVSAYEALLENAPVYSDNNEELAAAVVKTKNIFFKTIKKEYPHLVQGRDHIDERDIASLLFSRASMQDDYHRYADSGTTQEALNKADRYRRLERELALQHSNLNKGLNLYSKRRYDEAIGYFEEVLSFDRANEEAFFYWSLSGKRISAAAVQAGRTRD